MQLRWANVCLGVIGAVGMLSVAVVAAHAGGFAVREQSSYGQGASYAGVAAGGSLSSMFWNPATMTQVPGIQSESVLTGILPYSSNAPGSGSALTALGYGGTGNIADDALVPSGYFSWQVKPQLWIGMSVNAPYGLSESFPDIWAGRPYAAGDTHLRTYNFTPSVAYAINDWISVGAGVQIEYADATLTKGLGPIPTWQAALSGTGWGYGFTAGVTVKPTPTTTIGLGYRSHIDQKINGTLALPSVFVAPFSTPGSVSTTIKLPDTVSLGIRQKLGARWTAMATVEWANWSRIGTSSVLQPNGLPATIFNGVTSVPVTIPFEYKDGWLFSLGAQYQWNDRLTVRGGVGYEKSPITDSVRVPVVSDNDRTWLSVGASYQLTPSISADFAYSHLFVKSTPIDLTSASNPSYNGIAYAGNVDTHIDIVSLGLHFRWDHPKPATTMLYTK